VKSKVKPILAVREARKSMRLRTEAILSALQPRQDMSFREAKQLDTPSHAGPGQVFLPGCMKIFQGAGKICWSAEQRLLTFADPRRREDFGCIPGFSLGKRTSTQLSTCPMRGI